MIMMCQCGFILSKKCTILVSDADTRKGYIHVLRQEASGKISVSSSKVFGKPKTAIKNKIFIFKKSITALVILLQLYTNEGWKKLDIQDGLYSNFSITKLP